MQLFLSFLYITINFIDMQLSNKNVYIDEWCIHARVQREHCSKISAHGEDICEENLGNL